MCFARAKYSYFSLPPISYILSPLSLLPPSSLPPPFLPPPAQAHLPLLPPLISAPSYPIRPSYIIFFSAVFFETCQVFWILDYKHQR